MQRLPRFATKLTLEEMAKVLVDAFRLEMGRTPTLREAKWLMSIARLENANGRAIIQHNWGNRAHSGSEDYWVPPWADESLPDSKLSPDELATRVRMNAGKPVPRRFAAYPDHMTGARKFVRLFKSRTHARILEAAQRDDGEAVWRAIWTPHPVTKMKYCVECGTERHRKAYQSAADSSVRLFPDLPKA